MPTPTKCLVILFFAATQFNAFSQQHINEVKKIMDDARIPAISLAYIKEGKLQEQISIGVKAAESKAPVNDSTVFAACSLSKSVFSYGVYKLVKHTLLDLDRPLYLYYDYPDVKADERYKRVTARMILSHSSGLPNWRNGDLKFKYDLGKQYSYSGEGFVWLSKVVEQITNEPVEAYLQDAVFKPLAMTHSSYIWQKHFDSNYAYPHTDNGRSTQNYFPSNANVAASLQTNSTDYAKFIIAVLNDKDFLTALKTDTGMYVANNIRWNKGLGIEQTTYGSANFQWGDNGTFKAFLVMYPDKKEGLVYFANSENGLDAARDILKLFFNSNQPALDWLAYDSVYAPRFQIYTRGLSMPVADAVAPYLSASKKIDTALLSDEQIVGIASRYTELGYYDKSLELLKMNLDNFPLSAPTYRALGETYMRMGDAVKSAAAWQQAFALDKQYDYPQKLAARLLNNAEPRDTTNKKITLRFADYINAHFVTVAGSFNNWNNAIQPMHWVNGAWETTLQLAHGTYRYKFVVDGVWLPDPKNPNLNKDSFDSILEVD
ncbi:MAG TPA: serine hydrolase [Panacibacter sp.]|nr:serine hydrolase [Panacibacter sp.]HNP46185.1 serine hydrolase [Panacibacter sp.]